MVSYSGLHAALLKHSSCSIRPKHFVGANAPPRLSPAVRRLGTNPGWHTGARSGGWKNGGGQQCELW